MPPLSAILAVPKRSAKDKKQRNGHFSEASFLPPIRNSRFGGYRGAYCSKSHAVFTSGFVSAVRFQWCVNCGAPMHSATSTRATPEHAKYRLCPWIAGQGGVSAREGVPNDSLSRPSTESGKELGLTLSMGDQRARQIIPIFAHFCKTPLLLRSPLPPWLLLGHPLFRCNKCTEFDAASSGIRPKSMGVH